MNKQKIKISKDGQMSGDDIVLNYISLTLNAKGRVLIDSIWCG